MFARRAEKRRNDFLPAIISSSLTVFDTATAGAPPSPPPPPAAATATGVEGGRDDRLSAARPASQDVTASAFLA